jgi:hypothetical protein
MGAEIKCLGEERKKKKKKKKKKEIGLGPNRFSHPIPMVQLLCTPTKAQSSSPILIGPPKNPKPN